MKTFTILFSVINLTFCTILVKDTENNITVGRFMDAESKFGGDFDDGTMAYLIESHPLLACNNSIEPPPIYLPNGSNLIFVSLIKRGICTFEYKVRAAQKAGYLGVIIYNNNSDDYFPMPKPDNSNDDPITIPARMVGFISGCKLRKFTFTLDHQQFVIIFNDNDSNPQYYIIAFLAFVSLGFVLIGLGFIAKLCRECILRRSNRLKKCHLNKIPIKRFVKGEDLFDTCAICLDDFVNGNKLRILPCNHAYHVKCIDPWLLKQKRNCPMCKSRIKIPGREEDSDDSVSVIAPPEIDHAMNDEDTPLINPRDIGASQSYFSYNESNVNFVPDSNGANSQNYYENSCIIDNGKEINEAGSKTHVLCINDEYDSMMTLEESHHNNKPLQDLAKIV